jgi:hypothetical protein
MIVVWHGTKREEAVLFVVPRFGTAGAHSSRRLSSLPNSNGFPQRESPRHRTGAEECFWHSHWGLPSGNGSHSLSAATPRPPRVACLVRLDHLSTGTNKLRIKSRRKPQGALVHDRTLLPGHQHLPPKSEKCYPCVRYDLSPMSQAAHAHLSAFGERNALGLSRESCRMTGQLTGYGVALLDMPKAACSALEGAQIGQSTKTWRPSNELHRPSAAVATRRLERGLSNGFVPHDTASYSPIGLVKEDRSYEVAALPPRGWTLNFWQSRCGEKVQAHHCSPHHCPLTESI